MMMYEWHTLSSSYGSYLCDDVGFLDGRPSSSSSISISISINSNSKVVVIVVVVIVVVVVVVVEELISMIIITT